MAAVHPGGPLWSLTLKSILTEIVELKPRTETKNRNNDAGIKYLKCELKPITQNKL
jgi:hypothetical protein